jgi:UDPglucose 6-dehydrogenase
MKVGIIGFGFVGKALKNALKNVVSVSIADPKIGRNITDLINDKPSIIFVCVPTPMFDDGSQNIEIVKSVFNEISIADSKVPVILKSTVLPNHLCELHQRCKRFVYNPEFLTERNANQDFINSPLIIFGGDKKDSTVVSDFYLKYTKCTNKDHFFTDLITASLIKYSINSFLASKVIFFNELKNIFLNSGADDSWDNFIKILSTDSRIGASHMDVPGSDNRLGFGGACFPKDTNALLRFSKDIDAEFSLLKNVILLNNKIRGEYNERTKREKEQDINFNSSNLDKS